MKLKKIKFSGGLWKWAFLLLLASNLAFVTVLASRLVEVREPLTGTLTKKVPKTYAVGQVVTSRDKLNQLVTRYLKKVKTKGMTYQVHITEQAILFEGSYQFLGYQMPLYLYMTPYAMENGNIQLQVMSFSVGTLSLPQKDILQYLKKSYDLPDFVLINPKEASITLDLSKFALGDGLFLKAHHLDLKNDQLIFELYQKNK